MKSILLVTGLLMWAQAASADSSTSLSKLGALIHKTSAGQLVEVSEYDVVDAVGNTVSLSDGPYQTKLLANQVCDWNKPWNKDWEGDLIDCVAK